MGRTNVQAAVAVLGAQRGRDCGGRDLRLGRLFVVFLLEIKGNVKESLKKPFYYTIKNIV